MAKQYQVLFLEEWLQSIISSGNNKNALSRSASSSAQAIVQAWADLRNSLQNQSFHAHHLQALKILVNSQSSLHVADPQAKLLISILSSEILSIPPESYSLFFRLLYIWVRKSRQASHAVESAINILLHIFSQSHYERSSHFFSEGILLLGSLTLQTSGSEKSRSHCIELLSKLLVEQYRFIFSSDELSSYALAGIGYALSSSVEIYFKRILDILLSIWNDEHGISGNISQGLMILHMIEWVLSNSMNLRSLNKIDLVRETLEHFRPDYSSFAVVMVAAGVLRAVNRSGSSGFIHLKTYAENCLDIVATDLISRIEGFEAIGNQPVLNFLFQCIALALARSGLVSYRSSVLKSLALALLTEIFPLQHIYNKVLEFSEENWAAVLEEIDRHLNSILFKEAGAVTGVFCNQYALADEDSRSAVEKLTWDYCQEVYLLHRLARTKLIGRSDLLIREIEKIAESAFLMVVVFAFGITKHKFDARTNQDAQSAISVKILVSFSCMEYFRRMRLPEYMDTIRAVIASVQENESASATFVESMPSYVDLINGSSDLQNVDYQWSSDEVQAARIVFYMRVIPTCVERLPPSLFKKVVAPTMFLYIGHPNGKVSRYSHSMFVAFISSGKEDNQDDRVILKEQLVFYYLQRSLQGYPGITPFEGMASGVAAIVRHLPAGSPSTFYCIDSLVEKATSLCSKVRSDEIDMWKNWEGDLEPSKKVFDLLLRLLALVDIQVLPRLMKSLAHLIVELPADGQNILLDQLYQQIAESDDVIRKPALVSWIQSLSYLCSPHNDKRRPELGEQTTSATISLNTINARL